MTLDEYLGIDRTDILGTHRFIADEIKTFAAEFDPAPYHVDEEAARASVFGGLCASGWQTAAMWMHFNVERPRESFSGPWRGIGPAPEFGPSPGIRNLKWLQPVFADDEITYRRTGLSRRPHSRRPGWQFLDVFAEGEKTGGIKVIEFINTVLVKA